MKQLYLVLLGGKVNKERFGEDHQIVMVVAGDANEAKEIAKNKWNGINDGLHVDDVNEISNIDGYDIFLKQHLE